MNKYYRHEKISYDEIKQVRKDCINIPYKFFAFQIILFLSVGLLFNFIMLANLLSIIRFTLMIASIAALLSIMLLIVTQRYLRQILLTTYNVCPTYEKHTGYRITNSKNIIIQITPIFLVILIVLSLIGYSKAVTQEGYASANYYRAYIDNKDIHKNQINVDNLKEILNTIPLKNNWDYYFIITPDDKEIYTSKEDGEVSSFALDYRDFFDDRTGGIWYEKFGVDEQLCSTKLIDENGKTWYIGYKYQTVDPDLLVYYSILIVVVTLFFAYIVYYLTKNLSNHLITISTSLEDILNTGTGKQLPITSNDEYGDLSYNYNKIQELNARNIEEIQNNQEILMEKERLATLGQMVGGIAHNLKTPIMSISGASEGLKDLINEYDNSIGDSEVTVSDHHEIANDMRTWIEKINGYTAYMSDIITAVKGQAVTLSNQEVISFTVSELVKRVQILMKHELKNSFINLNVNMNVDENLELHGDINSLVQVLNNLISNAIQAYEGKQNENIDFDLNMEGNNLLISITDYGKGIPEDVQEKLFKEMVTTKGKNGTGLGLFMSYSNIRAHFNGNMRFESEIGRGTTFEIILPI
ncbi:MAG: HAMP domain-containing histidine kinase [Clostridia bacterium]|nr:HAMP domain-containing histidine kinase [Clostridia bacterium]